MQLNIKDPETIELARDLSVSRGQPVTHVVREALRREKQADATERAARVERILADLAPLTAAIHAGMIEKYGRVLTQQEWDDEFYDEQGLPR